MIKNRIEAAQKLIAKQSLDAILISSPENRHYLSGFTGSAGYLIISKTESVLATDFRYIELATAQSPDYKIHRISGGSDWLAEIDQSMNLSSIGFESQNLSYANHSAFDTSLQTSPIESIDFVPTTGLLEQMRIAKDTEEYLLLSKAIEISDQALDSVKELITPGMTERQVAWELEKKMRDLGADGPSFPTIVGAGRNGALPHHRPDDTIIQDGDPVVIDMGSIYKGYCSDLTRTIFIGEPDDFFKKIYSIVLEAQTTAEKSIIKGITAGDADKIARDVISNSGYGDNFGHSLGHGVGLEVHESPVLGPRSTDILEDGMFFTVEPGIYISGWGGVRIEDIVTLENGSTKILSQAHKLDFSS